MVDALVLISLERNNSENEKEKAVENREKRNADRVAAKAAPDATRELKLQKRAQKAAAIEQKELDALKSRRGTQEQHLPATRKRRRELSRMKAVQKQGGMNWDVTNSIKSWNSIQVAN